MPSVTAPGSPESSTVGTVWSSKRLHGHTPGAFGGLAVVKVHGLPDDTWLPWASVPFSVAVYFTKPLSGWVGVKVAVREVASYAVEPATVAPLASLRVSVAPVTALENFALTVVEVGTLLAPGSGHWLVATSGDSASVVNSGSTK